MSSDAQRNKQSTLDLESLRLLAAKFESYGDAEIGDAYSGPYYQCAQELRSWISQHDVAAEKN